MIHPEVKELFKKKKEKQDPITEHSEYKGVSSR